MAADLNYLSSEHPLHSERTTASGKMLAISLTGALPFIPDIPARNFCASRGFSTNPWSKVLSKALISRRAEWVVSSITITVSIARREASESFPIPRRPPLAHIILPRSSQNAAWSIVGRMSEMSRVAMSVHAGRPPGRRPQKTSPQSRQGQGLETRNESGSRSIVSVEADMSDHQREIYHSENGDRWWLCRDDGRVFVLHRANVSSGGTVTKIELGDFLGAGKAGPEHQALIRLIGSLVESG